MKNVILGICLIAASCGASTEEEMVQVDGRGTFVIVNASTKLGNVEIESVARSLGNIIQIKSAVTNGTWTIKSACDEMSKAKATAAVFLVENSDLPLSLVAIEEKWGMVNVVNLSGTRLNKEITRVATIVLGGASSKYKASAMRPAFSPEDLDNVGSLVTIDSLMSIYPNLDKLGFRQCKVMEYLDALEQGVAPAPVNENQRRIKDEYEKTLKK